MNLDGSPGGHGLISNFEHSIVIRNTAGLDSSSTIKSKNMSIATRNVLHFMSLLVSAFYLQPSPLSAGTVITTNLPPNTAIININATADGAAAFNGDQSLWYQPFNVAGPAQLLHSITCSGPRLAVAGMARTTSVHPRLPRLPR